ncbi:hypothetical protein O6H91_21G035900 [Diphasiastrum complanatum]|uniref:Uncharacterized protein n=1 Tax=Diphasiastrum complanatum TaxID=34168 RepID=A0ACC2AJS7_DIPCM|nr:hypothetical protein O6H91_21G035900 [Diphasiastrum complanatum]
MHLSNDERHKGFLKITVEELQRATNNFSVSNKLGEGGFSIVYRAILDDGTIVAAKLFKSKSCVVQESFFKECQILSKVRHKNIVKVVSAVSNLDTKALILQFISNGNLKEHLYKINNPTNRLTWETRLAIAINVAEAICYLHYGCHEPILHLDLKPSNILLDENKEAYVTDFGIAKLMNTSASGAEITATIRGSWGYIAREFAVLGQISVKADVYSYGIVLLELLTRRRPTDSAFEDGMNVRIWVQQALSRKHDILKVVDDALLNDRGDLVSQDICEALKTGIICSRISMEDRPSMRDVVNLLLQVKDKHMIHESHMLPNANNE